MSPEDGVVRLLWSASSYRWKSTCHRNGPPVNSNSSLTRLEERSHRIFNCQVHWMARVSVLPFRLRTKTFVQLTRSHTPNKIHKILPRATSRQIGEAVHVLWLHALSKSIKAKQAIEVWFWVLRFRLEKFRPQFFFWSRVPLLSSPSQQSHSFHFLGYPFALFSISFLGIFHFPPLHP